MLSSIGIDIDCLPPFQFSLDAPAHLLPSRQELNEHVRLDIYRRYITATWVNPPGGLCPRMSFYATHFLEISNGIIARPSYLSLMPLFDRRFFMAMWFGALLSLAQIGHRLSGFRLCSYGVSSDVIDLLPTVSFLLSLGLILSDSQPSLN